MESKNSWSVSEIPTILVKDLPSLLNISDHGTNNIFVIINNNRGDSFINNISSDDTQPKFDINKVSCPRCRYRAEKALKLLQSKTNLEIGDIKGICDHCKAQQLSQKTCAICEETVKKFLEEKGTQERIDKSIWFKQKFSHVHRLSSGQGTEKICLDTVGEKSTTDLKLSVISKTDLYKPVLTPQKHRVTVQKPPIERAGKGTPKVVEFPFDESIVTSFITTFSKTGKDHSDKSFKYIFPGEKTKTQVSEAFKITSSELIRTTQDKIRQQIEPKDDVTEDKYDEYYERKKSNISVLTKRVKEEDYNIRRAKETLSSVRTTDSKGAVVKSKDKDVKTAVLPLSKSYEGEITSSLQYTKAEKGTKGELKLQLSDVKSRKSIEDEIKPPPHDLKSKKSERGEEKLKLQESTTKEVKIKLPSQAVEAEEGIQKRAKPIPDAEKSTSQDIQTKTGKQGADKPPSQELKLKKEEGAEKKSQLNKSANQKETKTTLQEGKPKKDEKMPPLEDIKAKTKSDDKIKQPSPETKKDKKEVYVKQQLPDVKAKKGLESHETEKQGEEKKVLHDDTVKQDTAKQGVDKKSKELKKVEVQAPQDKIGESTKKKSELQDTKKDIAQPPKEKSLKEKPREEKPPKEKPPTEKPPEEKPPKEKLSKEKPPEEKPPKVKPPKEKPVKMGENKASTYDEKKKTRDQDEGKKTAQDHKSKQVEKKPPKIGDKNGEQTNKKAVLEDDNTGKDVGQTSKEKPVRMVEKKLPPSFTAEKPTLKEAKDTKAVEDKQKLKKEIKPPKPPAPVKSPKKKDEEKEPLLKDKDTDKVAMKNKATQVRDAEDRRKQKELEAARAKREKQDKLQEQTTKPQEDKAKDETKEVKKEDTSKNMKEEKQTKMKEADSKTVKHEKEPPKKEIVFDIMKFLPQKPVAVVKKADPLAAMRLAEKRMKDLEAAALDLARKEAEKKGALADLVRPKSHYTMFKVKVQEGAPIFDEANRKRKLKDVLSTVEMKTLQMKGPSYDNLVLNLVRLGKLAGKKATSSKIQRRVRYKIRSAKRTDSIWSLSVDSETQLDIERLARFVTVQQIKHIRHKIQGIEIVNNIPEAEKPKLQPDPILFYTKDEPAPLLQVYDVEEESFKEPEMTIPKGILRYSLSNPTFIEKGWTVLPTMKVVRKMNVYKVRPAHPEFDWFNYNKRRGTLNYDTGEKLADFDDNGRGRWYYKNGRIALDYYDSEDIHAQQRFVLYSSGEQDELCRSLVTVLGLFDYLGNGVVFDHSGKIRVKYNQTEGVVLDSGIGPSSRWKWHTLNDPPVLKQVMIDTFTEQPDPEIEKLGPDDRKTPNIDEDMLAIEIENVMKEKKEILSRKFKPFQIKMKALKINKQLSLRILDQAHVYLYFRDGATNIKLNLGMILDHQEIIDTDTADVADVSNVLERYPPQTESIVDLQDKLEKIRRCDRQRTEHVTKIRNILPISSADKLIQPLSKPLRHPVIVAHDHSDDIACGPRKPLSTNLYYNTRLI